MKLEDEQVIALIEKLLNGKGTDSEQEEWVNSIRESVPFYEKNKNKKKKRTYFDYFIDSHLPTD